jgi:single-strand DNA-binding protein
MAVIDGRLQLRDWTDRDGNKRRSAEILANSVHFGDSKPQNQAAPAPAGVPAGGGYDADDLEGSGDLPF